MLATACEPALPEPETAGARAYRARCVGCHRLYAPGSMTAEMWNVQVDRMRTEFARRGIPWPGAEEERVLRDYLTTHAGQG